MNERGDGTRSSRAAVAVAMVGGVAMVAAGLWSFFAPRSFYDQVATFPPYNPHLFHDVGAFLLGLGATLLLTRASSDALFVALGGTGVGNVFHFVSHLEDLDQGGSVRDVVLVGVLAAALAVGASLRWRDLRGASSGSSAGGGSPTARASRQR